MPTATRNHILVQHPLFAGLSVKQLDLVASLTREVRFEPGDFITREGQAADTCYLLRHGIVSVEINLPGKEPLGKQAMGEGDVLGWSWIVPPYQWRFSARVVEWVVALAIDGKSLRKACERDHDLGYQLLKQIAVILASRLRATRVELLEKSG